MKGSVFVLDAKKENIVCKPKWDWVSLFSRDGYALVNIGCDPLTEEEIACEETPSTGKFGLIDYDFNVVVPPKYDSVEWNIYCEIDNRRSRYCNVPPRYRGPIVRSYNINENQPVGKEWFVVSKDGQWGIIDRNENIIIPFDDRKLYVLSRECVLRKDGRMLYAGGESIPLDEVYVCKSPYETKVYLIVKRSRKYAVVRDDGTFASDFKFTFQQARQFVDIQFEGRTIVGKMV